MQHQNIETQESLINGNVQRIDYLPSDMSFYYMYSFRLTHEGKILLFLLISLNILWVDATTLAARLTGRRPNTIGRWNS
jgi:hypothetical protein